VKKEGEYTLYNPSFLQATQKGLDKFYKYYDKIKKNNIYWITYCLDPRVKTNWLTRNIPDHKKILN